MAVILTDVGFEIVALQKVGDSAIASGYMLGFGVGDFEQGHLDQKLLQPIHSKVGAAQRMTRLDESLYIGCFLVARKPEAAAAEKGHLQTPHRVKRKVSSGSHAY